MRKLLHFKLTFQDHKFYLNPIGQEILIKIGKHPYQASNDTLTPNRHTEGHPSVGRILNPKNYTQLNNL